MATTARPCRGCFADRGILTYDGTENVPIACALHVCTSLRVLFEHELEHTDCERHIEYRSRSREPCIVVQTWSWPYTAFPSAHPTSDFGYLDQEAEVSCNKVRDCVKQPVLFGMSEKCRGGDGWGDCIPTSDWNGRHAITSACTPLYLPGLKSIRSDAVTSSAVSNLMRPQGTGM